MAKRSSNAGSSKWINRKIIRESEYEEASDRLYELMDAEEGSEEEKELEHLSELIETYEDKHFPIEEPVYVRVRLLVDVRLNYVGKVTGNIYHFFGAGSEADVDENDVEIMMKKRVGGVCDGCPASSGPQPYFEIIS